MFYDALGSLVGYAGEVLISEVRPYVSDDRARTQLDAVAALCSDVGVLWPSLFAALAEENRILEGTLGAEPGHLDELARHRALLARMNECIDQARAASDGAERLAALRAAMRDAAAVQEAAMATAAEVNRSGVKRV